MNIRRLVRVGSLALGLALSVSAIPAKATTLVLDGGWETYVFGGTGSSWDQDFTFTLSSTATLKVTDAFLLGDQFAIFNFGSHIGDTNPVVADGSQTCGADYDACFAGGWSHASFVLGPGSYDISGTLIVSPFGSGGAALELVSSAVPGPVVGAGLPGLLAGVGAMLAWYRKRRAVAV